VALLRQDEIRVDEGALMESFNDLEAAVVKRQVCLNCGACVAACPVGALKLEKNLPRLVGKCINCGICYRECLQTAGYSKVAESLKLNISDLAIGQYHSAFIVDASSKEVKDHAQDGGAVTSILQTLLEYEYVDGVIATGIGPEPLLPEAKVITTPEDLLECAGSKYARGPLFPAVIDAVRKYNRKHLAVVGLPCQVATIRRIQTSEPTNRQLAEAVKLTIGLFCEGAFDHRFFREVVENQARVPLVEVEKVEISGGKITVHRLNKSPREIPLTLAKKYLDAPCRICSDFSSELADISVGSAGSPAGKSTVILRTEAGIEAFNFAARFNKFRAKSLDPAGSEVEEVRTISRRKKTAAEKTIQRMRADKKPLPIWVEG